MALAVVWKLKEEPRGYRWGPFPPLLSLLLSSMFFLLFFQAKGYVLATSPSKLGGSQAFYYPNSPRRILTKHRRGESLTLPLNELNSRWSDFSVASLWIHLSRVYLLFHSIPVLSDFLVIRLRCLLLTLLRNDNTVESVTELRWRTDLIQRKFLFQFLFRPSVFYGII